LIARATARRNSGQSECKVSPQYIHRARATPYLWQSRSKRSLRQPMSASPWSIEERQESFNVKDPNGQSARLPLFRGRAAAAAPCRATEKSMAGQIEFGIFAVLIAFVVIGCLATRARKKAPKPGRDVCRGTLAIFTQF